MGDSRSPRQVPAPGSASNIKHPEVDKLDKQIDQLYKRLKAMKYKRKRLVKRLEQEEKEEGKNKFQKTWKPPKKEIKKGS